MKNKKRMRMHKYLRKKFKTQGSRSAVLPDINISQLAREAGLSRSNISKLVNRLVDTGPSLGTLLKLKAALGLETIEATAGWLKRVQARKDQGSKGKGSSRVQNSKFKKAG